MMEEDLPWLYGYGHGQANGTVFRLLFPLMPKIVTLQKCLHYETLYNQTSLGLGGWWRSVKMMRHDNGLISSSSVHRTPTNTEMPWDSYTYISQTVDGRFRDSRAILVLWQFPWPLTMLRRTTKPSPPPLPLRTVTPTSKCVPAPPPILPLVPQHIQCRQFSHWRMCLGQTEREAEIFKCCLHFKSECVVIDLRKWRRFSSFSFATSPSPRARVNVCLCVRRVLVCLAECENEWMKIKKEEKKKKKPECSFVNAALFTSAAQPGSYLFALNWIDKLEETISVLYYPRVFIRFFSPLFFYNGIERHQRRTNFKWMKNSLSPFPRMFILRKNICNNFFGITS